ncbi:MAG TPA: NfeD family protein [Firmicutes bacterium]|nr:NfeD family protein [Bacillota bacterium]
MSLDPWQWWLIGAILLAVAELVTVGFFIIWFAAGALVAMVAALAGTSLLGQGVLFVVSSGVLVVLTRPLVQRLVFSRASGPATAVDALPGREGLVLEGIAPFAPGQVRVDGVTWTAVSDEQTIEAGTRVRVVKVDGVKLVVEPVGKTAEPRHKGE